MDQPVIPLDLYRMFFGKEDLWYLAEIAVRTSIVLTYTFALLRWVGHRAVGQLSLIEFLLVIALGAAVGDALFYPNTPLAHALLVITLVVLFDKTLDALSVRFPPFSDYLTGKPICVVRNGVAEETALEEANLPLSELHEQLRLKGVTNLGQVAMAYLETNGRISVVMTSKSKAMAGQAIVPPVENAR